MHIGKSREENTTKILNINLFIATEEMALLLTNPVAVSYMLRWQSSDPDISRVPMSFQDTEFTCNMEIGS